MCADIVYVTCHLKLRDIIKFYNELQFTAPVLILMFGYSVSYANTAILLLKQHSWRLHYSVRVRN